MMVGFKDEFDYCKIISSQHNAKCLMVMPKTTKQNKYEEYKRLTAKQSSVKPRFF